MDIAAKLDERGRGAWIVAMILGFVLFWPIGLAILAYMIWSRRMGCMHQGWKDEWRSRRGEMRDEMRARKEEWKARKREMHDHFHEHWFGGHEAMKPSGNAAFDEYKIETLKRLEEEQAEFTEFLDNLRKSRDKAEFDDFMKNRRQTIDPDKWADDGQPTA
jgi:Protein of unknown function (DUF2852)